MNDLFGQPITEPLPVAHPVGHSRKQRAILAYLGINKTITLAQAVELVGSDVYRNQAKHTGALLSNMVRRGLLVRIKPGLFSLP